MKKKQSKRVSPKKSPSHKSIYNLLSTPLPVEALSPIPGTSRISINDAYVKERLNEVLGPQGWEMLSPQITYCELWRDVQGQTICDTFGKPFWNATASVAVRINALKKVLHGEGGHQSVDRGDARKGAVTDAFGKALSDLIGIEVYKGEVDAQNMPAVEQYSPTNGDGESESRGRFVYYYGICSQHLPPDLAVEPEGHHWFRLNRRLCYISQVDFEQYLSKHMPIECKEIHVHALRDTSQRKYTHELKVTSVLQVRKFDSIKKELER